MSSTTNIPTNARTMSGQIIISDGVAVLENGSLTNVSNIDTNTINTSSFSTNDFIVNTNIDLTSNDSKIQFLYNSDPNNTLIDRVKVNTQTVNANDMNSSNADITTINATNVNTYDLDVSNNIYFKSKPNDNYGIYIDNGSSTNSILTYRGGAYNSIMIGEGTPSNTTIPPNNIIIGTSAGYQITTGNNNTVCGYSALNNTQGGGKNTALGAYALNAITNGSFNTGLGFSAGFNPSYTQYNTHNSLFLGSYARANANIYNSVALGYGCIVDSSYTIQLGSNSETVNMSGNVNIQGYFLNDITKNTNDGIITGYKKLYNSEYSVELTSPHSVWVQSPQLVLKGNEITEVEKITMNSGTSGGIYNVNEITAVNDFKIYCGGQLLINDNPIGATNLNNVLATGNDANNQSITNVNEIYAKQFIYDNFVRLNDLQTISTSIGTYTLTFPMPQIINIINTGSLTLNLPDLSILPTGGAGSNIYILRGDNTSQITLQAYTGQQIKLMDNSLVSTFLFNSSVSNMLNLMFTRVGNAYRWVQVNPIVSNATTTGVIDTPSVYTLNEFSALNTFNAGIQSLGDTYVENFTFSNVSSDITITNWDASTPLYSSNNYYLQYSGSSSYNGVGFSTSLVSGTAYTLYITRGTSVSPFFITYFPSGITSQQTFTIQPAQNSVMKFITSSYTLQEGEYKFGFWVQNSNNTGGNCGFASVNIKNNTTSAIINSISNINPISSYPNWVFHSIPFNLSTDTNIVFEFITTSPTHIYGGYINLVGLELTKNSAIVINDQTTNKTATVGANQSILNNVFVYDALDVKSGGLSVVGGLNTNSNYGENNTVINSTFASTSGSASSQNNVAIGHSSLQAGTSSSRNVSIGSSAMVGATTASDNVCIGYSSSCSAQKSVNIGSQSIQKGNESVLIGYNVNSSINQGIGGDYNSVVGVNSLGSNVYNGYGVLTAKENSVFGTYSQYNSADHYNSSFGAYSLFNMNGRAGITANGNNGTISQYNNAFGYKAGYLQAQYNNCLFLGAFADASVNNLTNATAIGNNARVELSNCIQLGSNGERVNISGNLYVNNINLTNINGVPYSPTGSSANLSDVLQIGNSSGIYDINLNNNDLLNVNNINLTTINGSAYPPTSSTPTLSTVLAAGNDMGTSSIIANSVDISPTELSYLNGVSSNIQTQLNAKTTLADIQANLNTFSVLQYFNGGLRLGERSESLTGANLDLTSNFAYYCGSKICINTANAHTYQILLPSPSLFAGSTTWICNRTNYKFTLSCSGVNFLGRYGSQTTTHVVYPYQEVEIYANSANWCIDGFKGAPYVSCWYSSTLQTIGNAVGAGTIVQLPNQEINDITTATGRTTWAGKTLTYFPTAGGANPQYSWGNQTGYTMVVSVEAQIMYAFNAAGVRALWIGSGTGTGNTSSGRYFYTPNMMYGNTPTFPSASGYVRAQATLTLAPNDYVILYTYQNCGGGLNIENNTGARRGNITFTRIG